MQVGDPSGNRDDEDSNERAIGELSAILKTSLMALGDAGRPDDACRLAARACAALRQPQRRQWHIFNTLLHRLSPKSGAVGTPGPVGQ